MPASKIEFYLHNSYDFSEVRDYVREQLPHLTDAQLEVATEEIYSKFHEVEFAVTLSDDMNITSVTMIEEK